MKIQGLRLLNFKSFKGEHKLMGLDDNLTENQNIVLIGGFNGAGKTTFLEAVYLCLYGIKSNLAPTEGAKAEPYPAFLFSMLNNNEKHSGKIQCNMEIEMFVSDLELTSTELRNVSFKRSWQFIVSDKGQLCKEYKEDFVILENGIEIEEIEREEHKNRIYNIIPYSISQFFVFDGEKIAKLASDSNAQFAESLKNILGLSLYETLYKDLKKTKDTLQAENALNKNAVERKITLRSQYDLLLEGISGNEEKIKSIHSDIEEEKNKKSILEYDTQRISRISSGDGSNYSQKKEDYKNQKETQLIDFNAKVKDKLPFILSSNLFEDLLNQIDKEYQVIQSTNNQKEIEPQVKFATNAVFENVDEGKELPIKMKNYYISRLTDVITELLTQETNTNSNPIDVIHDLSARDSEKVKSFINNISALLSSDLTNQIETLNQLDTEISRLERIDSQDTSGEFKKLFEDLALVNSTIGRYLQSIETLEDDIKEKKREISNLEGAITKVEKEIKVNEEIKIKMDYCDKLRETIKEFQKQFRAKRTIDLQKSILEMWNLLTHKENFVSKVLILPDSNFEIKLFQSNNIEIDKTKLSAGEKEVYAISLLWALTQVSGIQLPIIIDTPFGRLDGLHRMAIVKQYFPKASQQVILLSQNEEIVEEYYDALKPCIAAEYTIVNNGQESHFQEGYPFISKTI